VDQATKIRQCRHLEKHVQEGVSDDDGAITSVRTALLRGEEEGGGLGNNTPVSTLLRRHTVGVVRRGVYYTAPEQCTRSVGTARTRREEGHSEKNNNPKPFNPKP